MRHRLPTIAIFLLLGALVNVAVAWTCAYRVGFGPFEARQYELESGQSWSVLSWKAFGSRRVVSVRPVSESSETDPVRGRRPVFPGWSDIRGDHVPASGPSLVLEAAEARGWPLLSLAARLEAGSKPPSLWAGESPDAVEIQPPANAANVYDASGRTLPLRPIWLGFAADTLFYAAAAWLLSRIPLALRRFSRARRGLCPACGYPPGAAAVCTECGRALEPARPARAADRR
ncbi:MAG: hypothetical protein ACYSWT_05920 [Planctomycetota bacterium]|jgi:hypothetical protein